MALAVLLHRWARRRGGKVTALTVDHGLRKASAAEAVQVGRTLRPLGLSHRILYWRGDRPTANVQAVARRARYALLGGWCARHGVLHLALGHQLEDQAETLLLRLGRGSGLDGLAAMAAVIEMPAMRLLRPLLALPRARLEATLRRRGLPWIEDPTNQDPAFARVRLRELMPALVAEGMNPARLATTATQLGRARAALAQSMAMVLARAVSVHPAGFVWVDPAPLASAAPEVGLRALARIVMLVGGLEYPPRLERLERLYGRVAGGLGSGTTLGGCRFIPRHGRILVVREPTKAGGQTVQPGEALHWDHRFALRVHRQAQAHRGGLTVGPLGIGGWAEVKAAKPGVSTAIPAPARHGLPALRDGLGVISVPQLGYERSKKGKLTMMTGSFSPRISLTTGSFTVA